MTTNPSHVVKPGRRAFALHHPTHVLEAALAGADVCTMAFDILEQLYHHPLTDLVLNQFLTDWAKAPK